jgi:L-gulono-1,4-lactone dehydrogenase
MAEIWTNWAREQRCAPERIERPQSEEELQEIVARADRVKAVGTGHSFSDIACSDGVMVDLSAMNRILDVDGQLVRVQAGIRIADCARQLAERGLALENQGDIDRQALAGAVATATHGTGVRFRNLSAQVERMRLVTASGETRDLEGEELLAGRVSLGALGVVSELTMRCVPAFTIHRVDEPRPLEEVLDGLDDSVDGNDHFELFVFPYASRALTLTSERTDRAPEPRPDWRRRLDDRFENGAIGLASTLSRVAPRLAPTTNRTLTRLMSRDVHVDLSHRVYAHERNVRFTEMEYAISRAHAREALERVLDTVERRRLPVNFPIEVRFAAGDEAYLSTAHGRDTGYIAVHVSRGCEFETYFRAVERIMDDYDGRPHWGKRHYQTAATLRPRYPQWDRFQEVRARLDPDGVFANDYLARVLGPVGSGRQGRRRRSRVTIRP